MTDDQTLEQMSALPRTRKLIGTQGVKFKRFYVTDPLCCPSRATFLTGQYAHNTGVISNGGPNALAALDEDETLGVWLQQAGYRTAFVGKYLNDYGLDDPEQRAARVERVAGAARADDAELLRLRAQRGRRRHPLRHRARRLQDPGARPPRRRRGPPRRARRPPALPLRRLQRAARAEHAGAPRRRLARGRERAAHARLRRGRPLRQAELPPRPPAARRTTRSPASTSRNQRALESLAEVDRQVARIVDALRDKEELGSTYIVFTSDNGYLDGEHRIEFGKLLAYEPASQVPLLIRGPGIPAGETSDALVGNVDLAPTIAAIAEAEPTLEVDGSSLLSLAADPRGVQRPRAADRVAGPRPLDLLRLSLRGDPQRPLPLRRLRDRRRGALQPRPATPTSSSRSPATRATPTSSGRSRRRSTRLRDCRGEGCEVTVEPTGAERGSGAPDRGR